MTIDRKLPFIPGNPTKFIEWLSQSRLTFDGPSCPLECYLLAQGATEATVGNDYWSVVKDGAHQDANLPRWALTFVSKVDTLYGRAGRWHLTGKQAKELLS